MVAITAGTHPRIAAQSSATSPRIQGDLQRRPATIRARIPLRVERHVEGMPVTLGVPFPKGALASPDHVRLLTHEGRELPAQITGVTTWEPIDRSVNGSELRPVLRRVEECHETLDPSSCHHADRRRPLDLLGA